METPDILKPMPTANPRNVDIYTNVLSPQTSSQSRCLFVLNNYGVLAPTSRLVFSVLTTDTTKNNAFWPLHTGAAAAISGATLKCGTRVLARSNLWNYYNTMKSAVHENCDMRLIDMPLSGKIGNVGNSPETDGKYSVDVLSGSYTTSKTGFIPPQYYLTNDKTSAAEWTIQISELFPMMRGQMLSLQYFKLPLSIEIEFTQQSASQMGRVCCFNQEPIDRSITYDLDALKMNLDIIMYDSETMESLRNDIYGPGVMVRYQDLQTTQTSIPAVPRPLTGQTSENDITREVMSAGLVVNNVLLTERVKQNEVSEITITNGGTKYASVPAVSFPAGDGNGATATAVLHGSPIEAITAGDITGGSGYSSAPTASVPDPTGTQPDGSVGVKCSFDVVITSGAITGVSNFVAGSGYLSAPVVSLSGGGGAGGAIVLKTDGGVVKSITINQRGQDYVAGNITIGASPGGGTQATGTFSVREKKNLLLGDYVSKSPIHNSFINWRANDRIIYPRRVENTAYMRQQVEDVLEYPLTCPSILYSLDCENNFYSSKDGGQNKIMDDQVAFESHSPQELAGSRYYQGLQMRVSPFGEGTEISGSQNIIYERHNTFSHNDFAERELRFFTEYERQFMLKDGEVMVSS